jgi:lysophospholipase L1-like esterase
MPMLSAKHIVVAIVLWLMAFTPIENAVTKIILVGDSTMSIKETKAYPETGWGMPFVFFWDSTVQVINFAKNGRSTKTCINEGIWNNAINTVQKGDYVLIQFGHNDESIEKKDRYTTPEEYTNNLTMMVTATKEKGGYPVLITPVSRRKFNNENQAIATHAEYSALVKKVAASNNIPLIDLDEQSKQLYQTMGVENSKLLFLQLAKNEHPNYPDGKTDNTHFNELGARLIAQLVLKNLQTLQLPIVERIRKIR